MCHFLKNCGYPDSVVNTAQHRAQQIDQQSALQTSQKEKNERIPFTLTYHSLYKPSATHNSLIHSDEGLTLEASAFNLFTVANLPYQLS